MPDYKITTTKAGRVLEYRGAGGKRVRKRLWSPAEGVAPSRQGAKEAKARAERYMADLDSSCQVKPRRGTNGPTTIGQWHALSQRDRGSKGNLSERSFTERARTLGIFTHWCAVAAGLPSHTPLSKITPSLIERYRNEREKGGIELPTGNIGRPVNAAALRRELSVLKRAFNYGLELDILRGVDRNPVTSRVTVFNSIEDCRTHLRDKSMSDEHLAVLLDRIHDTHNADNRGAAQVYPITTAYMETLIRLLADTGMRPGEARLARWDHLDWEKGLLRIREGKTGSRMVVLSDSLLEFLRDRLATLPANRVGETIVADLNGQSITHHAMGKSFRRYRDRLGLPLGVTLYGLRHRFAHRIADAHPMPVVAAAMGHSGFRTTALYTACEVENIADDLRRTLAG